MRPGTTFVIDVASVPRAVDLSAYAGRFVTVRAMSADVYLLFAESRVPAEALSPTARDGDRRAYVIPVGQAEQFVVFASRPWLGLVTVSSPAVVRAFVTSYRHRTRIYRRRPIGDLDHGSS